MFEIGSTLREARERRRLSLAEVERDTRIRARWLQALEEERFDVLPERVYAAGFLRTYARYLGLEEQRFVDELSSRLGPERVSEAVLVPQAGRSRRRPATWLVAAAIVAAVAVFLVGLIGLGGRKHQASPLPATTTAAPRPATTTTTTPATTVPQVAPKPKPKPKPRARVARLLLTASRGRCWLDARLGSPNGRELHFGTLEVGQTLRLSGRRIWIRLGAASQLDAFLNGRRTSLPATTPVNVVVTASGVRAAS